MLWSTVSKAFFRSRKITPLIFSISILYAQESVASSKAVTVEWIARKQDWCLHSLSCSSKWAYNCSYNILSYTPTTTGITETGRRLFTLSRSSCLKRGATLTDLQSSGSLPCLKEWLKRSHIGTQMRSVHSWISLTVGGWSTGSREDRS